MIQRLSILIIYGCLCMVLLLQECNTNLIFICIWFFGILKRFKVIFRPSYALNIVEIFWQSPLREWIKFNCDRPLLETTMFFFGVYASFLVVSNFFIVEFSGAMQAIEYANEKNWHKVWLEMDSTAVVKLSILCIVRLGWLGIDELIVLI